MEAFVRDASRLNESDFKKLLSRLNDEWQGRHGTAPSDNGGDNDSARRAVTSTEKAVEDHRPSATDISSFRSDAPIEGAKYRRFVYLVGLFVVPAIVQGIVFLYLPREYDLMLWVGKCPLLGISGAVSLWSTIGLVYGVGKKRGIFLALFGMVLFPAALLFWQEMLSLREVVFIPSIDFSMPPRWFAVTLAAMTMSTVLVTAMLIYQCPQFLTGVRLAGLCAGPYLQLTFSLVFAYVLALSRDDPLYQVGLCALYPVGILPFKKLFDGFLVPFGGANSLLGAVVEFQSVIYAGLPYRFIYFEIDGWITVLQIWIVKIFYKLIVYPILLHSLIEVMRRFSSFLGIKAVKNQLRTVHREIRAEKKIREEKEKQVEDFDDVASAKRPSDSHTMDVMEPTKDDIAVEARRPSIAVNPKINEQALQHSSAPPPLSPVAHRAQREGRDTVSGPSRSSLVYTSRPHGDYNDPPLVTETTSASRGSSPVVDKHKQQSATALSSDDSIHGGDTEPLGKVRLHKSLREVSVFFDAAAVDEESPKGHTRHLSLMALHGAAVKFEKDDGTPSEEDEEKPSDKAEKEAPAVQQHKSFIHTFLAKSIVKLEEHFEFGSTAEYLAKKFLVQQLVDILSIVGILIMTIGLRLQSDNFVANLSESQYDQIVLASVFELLLEGLITAGVPGIINHPEFNVRAAAERVLPHPNIRFSMAFSLSTVSGLMFIQLVDNMRTEHPLDDFRLN
ncbi:unnamed protein product [Vitrella brassicaformis CCMP3155]|uniref:Uncharacterized protein n=2 Tax=Vitrella brassicaformis TaxID=1169539 RepID=A0A0G4GWL2_VITBC|nr:unnamed protein product [Vitrella brassicaformis CCMP3155]|eukprot:CEM35366.1 unnamed protein product [Vitrella brassicaformis CCMP3155]